MQRAIQKEKVTSKLDRPQASSTFLDFLALFKVLQVIYFFCMDTTTLIASEFLSNLRAHSLRFFNFIHRTCGSNPSCVHSASAYQIYVHALIRKTVKLCFPQLLLIILELIII